MQILFNICSLIGHSYTVGALKLLFYIMLPLTCCNCKPLDEVLQASVDAEELYIVISAYYLESFSRMHTDQKSTKPNLF